MEMVGKLGNGDSSNKDCDEGSMNRVYLGGLSGSVTAEDIKKTFSSLGNVCDIEIIRTKGRSFAYMDFFPNSQSALSRLFSMYNGCIWKGGRLKLEKAKEHYMARLQREKEDAKLADVSDEDTVKQAGRSQNPKNDQNIKEIHIYLSNLRKVKSLPYSGSGKHKYSFRRLDHPPNPIHFCDCEEHSQGVSRARAEGGGEAGARLVSKPFERKSRRRSLTSNKTLARNTTINAPPLARVAHAISHNVLNHPSTIDPTDDGDDNDGLIMNMVCSTHTNRRPSVPASDRSKGRSSEACVDREVAKKRRVHKSSPLGHTFSLSRLFGDVVNRSFNIRDIVS